MIPKTMKAWILTQTEKLELQEVPVPVSAENRVLVKIDRACICNGSDPGIYHGHEAYQTPLIFGYEASGRIVKKGKDVTKWELGELVLVQDARALGYEQIIGWDPRVIAEGRIQIEPLITHRIDFEDFLPAFELWPCNVNGTGIFYWKGICGNRGKL